MIRIVDTRSNEYEQIHNHPQVQDASEVYEEERYVIRNNVHYIRNIPPEQSRNDNYSEQPFRRCSDDGFQNMYQTQYESHINIDHVNDNSYLQNYQEIHHLQDSHYHVPISRNVIDNNEHITTAQQSPEILQQVVQRSPEILQPVLQRSSEILQPVVQRSPEILQPVTQRSPEILQPMVQNGMRRSTVLRHSSSIPKEELLRDRYGEAIQTTVQHSQPSDTVKRTEDFIKVLKPCEINKNLPTIQRSNSVRESSDLDQNAEKKHLTGQGKYHLLKRQLLSREPILNRIKSIRPKDTSAKQIGDKEPTSSESIIFSDRFSIDAIYHPYAITKELSEANYNDFSPEDLTLRYEVMVLLWVLLGETRLLRTGYPSASIHLVLWRVVHICCSVVGLKSAAAVPLPGNHNCQDNMLCFRDHVHRFLEICAPTRDLWKQFGWASLTVDAVMRKVYKQELLHVILQDVVAIPTPIRMAIRKLAILEREEKDRVKRQIIARLNSKLSQNSALIHNKDEAPNFRTIQPKPPEKRKRGRPIKVKKNLPDTGRIQRVMLWRFIMNLLEEPGNEDCIHWVKRDEGIFRILNTDWLARIWGRRHGNPRMTYEKMARAMRTYYRSKVLQPVPRARNLPRKLVYKFNPALVRKLTAS